MTSLDAQRARFPGLAGKVYFNFGTQGPMPREAIDAFAQAMERNQRLGPASAAAFAEVMEDEERLREAMAGLLSVAADRIALVDSTCTGLSIVLQGLPWRAGDHVLLGDAEYPAVEMAVRRLEPRFGVTHTVVPAALDAARFRSRLEAAWTPRTRLVVVSHVLWTTGEVVAVDSLAQLCRARGAHLLVDGAQSIGALPPVTLNEAVSFYAFPAHKHLCGPAGVGALYVAPFAEPELEPVFAGWRGVLPDGRQRAGAFMRGARRYEQGTTTFATRPALLAALAVHDGFASAEVRARHALAAAARLRERLAATAGVELLLPEAPASTLVGFRVAGCEPDAAVVALAAAGVHVRALAATRSLRATTHYLTSNDDIDGLVSSVARLAARGSAP